MKINPVVVALKAKGPYHLYQRSRSIVQRYGFSAVRMDQALTQFANELRQYDCGATFPITAAALKRHPKLIAKFFDQNIEFAVHGYTHIDYANLAPEKRLEQLKLARLAFNQAGISAKGFRSPYLIRDDHLNEDILSAGFSYVSNQPILWEVLNSDCLAETNLAGYERAVNFYQPWQACKQLSLPQQTNGLVEIPVSLPDDEMLIERLSGSEDLISETWRKIFIQSFERGELFTLQLHPERISLCVESLRTVLSEARAKQPYVWCARLDEIADWWKLRASANLQIFQTGHDEYQCDMSAPTAGTVLARGVVVHAPETPWIDGYRQVNATNFSIQSSIRPAIGVSPSSVELSHFLQRQGYLTEINEDSQHYPCYLDIPMFDSSMACAVLSQIAGTHSPLLRLGLWPNGAKSALAVTGDIDALTLWDYGLRVFGK